MTEFKNDGDRLRYMGVDATKWAAEMARVFESLEDIKLDPTPGGLLHGWLCGAIETGRAKGYEDGRSRGQKEAYAEAAQYDAMQWESDRL